VEGVRIQAEFVTVGDDRVCPDCLDLASGGPYTLEEIEGMIPAHPMCRCIALPLRPGHVPETRVEPSPDMIDEDVLPKDIRNELSSATSEDGLERSLLIDSKGNRLTDVIVGDADSVGGFHPAMDRAGANLTSIHTHPSMTPFSVGDVRTLSRYDGIRKMITIAPNKKAQMMIKQKGVGRNLEKRVDELFTERRLNLVDQISEGTLTKAQAKKALTEYRTTMLRQLEKENLIHFIDEFPSTPAAFTRTFYTKDKQP